MKTLYWQLDYRKKRNKSIKKDRVQTIFLKIITNKDIIIIKIILCIEITSHHMINIDKFNQIKIEMSHLVILLCQKITIITNKELIMLQQLISKNLIFKKMIKNYKE
jgi:hypothetical protein